MTALHILAAGLPPVAVAAGFGLIVAVIAISAWLTIYRSLGGR